MLNLIWFAEIMETSNLTKTQTPSSTLHIHSFLLLANFAKTFDCHYQFLIL